MLTRTGRAAACGVTFAALSLPIALLTPTSQAVPAGTARSLHGTVAGTALPGRDSDSITLPDGSTALVDTRTGVARVTASDGTVTYRRVPATGRIADATADVVLPDKAQLAALLARPPREPFASDRVIVVLTDQATPQADAFTASPQDLAAAAAPGGVAPHFTSSPALNEAMSSVGVDAGTRLFGSVSRDTLRGLTADAARASGQQGLALANAFVLHLTSGDPRTAAAALLRQPGVALADLDWSVEPSGESTALSSKAMTAQVRSAQSRAKESAKTASGIDSWRSNFGIVASAQSFWNSPGLDAAAAFDEIVDRYDQLPGKGQIITEVGLGDLTDDNPASRCFESGFGPTTVVHGGQRYIDLPSMPLVPTYTANSDAVLNPLGEVCGPDPLLRSIGHDLSVMAPLPKDLQRPENPGTGLTDLLGLAPGAKFRVVVPGSDTPTVSDVSVTLLAAALQAPHADVITTGIVASGDGQGFPQRYLEQDPLAQAVISTIVNALDISVCVGAGDGVRRNSSIAATGPSGGSVPTDVVPGRQAQTTLDDIALSSARSLLHDSGAISVGATTENDIFADPPHYSHAQADRGQSAFAATRWTGATDFASGFGSLVDLSAPGDSILSMSHLAGGTAPEAQPNLGEGTGISAAEVAASVAVVRQVGDLTGQSLDNPRDVRELLQQTATPVSDVPQADRHLEIGGQVNLTRAVERLLASAGTPVAAGMARFTVAQRRAVGNLDALFETGTNPKAINLRGPRSPIDGTLTGANKRAWISIAPDWEGVPDDASYQLSVTGEQYSVVARTPDARLLPAEILHAAGLPTDSPDPQTVAFNYAARWSGHSILAHLYVVFGPSPLTSSQVLAPRVAPVVDGDTVNVHYDLRHARGLQVPVSAFISYPGRTNPATGAMYDPLLSVDLPYQPGDPSSRVGTVRFPVAELEGAGIYGVGLHLADQEVEGFVIPVYSDFAYTRVAASSTDQPKAPLVSLPNGTPGHHVRVSYGGSVRVEWDASAVPGADGAVLEVSAAGPASAVGVNTFNNPEGDRPDHNDVDTGFVVLVGLPGVQGHLTRSARELGISPTMTHGLRVLATQDGKVIGEASPVSTVARDGVRPVGNDRLNESGFALGTGKPVGYLATRDFDRRGNQDSSVQTFHTMHKRVSATLAQIDGGQSSYKVVGNGLFGTTGLFGTYDAFSQGEALEFHGIVDGDLQPWTPPDPTVLQVRTGAADPNSGRGLFLALDASEGNPTAYSAFTSRVAADSFGPLLDVSGPLAGKPVSRVNQTVYDAAGGRAMAGFASNDFCAPPTIEQIDTVDGSAQLVPGVGFGDPFSMAIDRPAGVVAVATSCSPDLGLYDLDAGSSILVDLGQNGYYVAADDSLGLIFVAKAVPPDFFDNHVVQSSIAVYTADGSYVKELGGLSLWDVPLVPGLDLLQVDPITRAAWIFGPLGRQLTAIPY